MYSLEVQNTLIEALRLWREADHADTLTLCRNEVCVLLDYIERLK